ncbi:MAG TPA: ATP synthase F1 subunit gamma [Candidatus Baltobacteraceae bacterium]|jgi:F-type H+-transporting ATPase subunit gamma|nr:ATP synthase F1 subunit gamma [Candidatus Baltobacteraceae bacterium]
MPSVKDLRDRIKSLKNTQQITKAMKQVAAAKIRRAEQARKQARPYADAIGTMLSDLVKSVWNADHPFLRPGASGVPAGVVLLTADKGLCGAFNSNVLRAGELYRVEERDAQFFPVGIKARNAVRRWGQIDRPTWALAAKTKLETAREVAARVSDDFISGRIGSIVLISSRLISMMSQRPEVRRIVPIVVSEFTGDEKSASEARGAVEFLPSPELVLSRLLPKYLEFTLYSAMLETDAAFFAAQLLAMNNATENAGKLIDELTIQMNNARQAAITKELLEIVGGAEALSA